MNFNIPPTTTFNRVNTPPSMECDLPSNPSSKRIFSEATENDCCLPAVGTNISLNDLSQDILNHLVGYLDPKSRELLYKNPFPNPLKNRIHKALFLQLNKGDKLKNLGIPLKVLDDLFVNYGAEIKCFETKGLLPTQITHYLNSCPNVVKIVSKHRFLPRTIFNSILGSNILYRIESIDLTFKYLKKSDLKEIPTCKFLKELSLGIEYEHNKGIPELPPTLEKIDFYNIQIKKNDAEKIATIHTSITDLNLDSCSITPETINELFQPGTFPKLRSLGLSHQKISTELLTTVIATGILPQLSVLRLGTADLDDHQLGLILSQTTSLQLTSLCLAGNKITANGVKAVASSPKLNNLIKLNLSFNPIGDEGARAIASSTTLTKLASLKLTSCDIGVEGVEGVEGVKAVASSPKLNNLIKLNLSFNPIGDEGARAIFSSTTLTKLASLKLTSALF